ncbi:MAG: PorT family protein [Bacteroidales bacterium]|nr:PorT family protein [Bacteroidales bacterium]
MRRVISIIICILSLCTVSAETHYKPHIYIGGRAGMTMGKISFSPNVHQGWQPGTTGAVTVRYTEEKLFALIGEFGWTQRGWNEAYDETDLHYSRSLTYLTLPILTQIYFGSPRVKAFVNLGPEFNYLLGSSISSNFDYQNVGTVADFPARRRTEQLTMDIKNRFDYGIMASVGGEFYIQPRHSVVLEARFYFGLGNIFPSSKADVFSASRNMSLEFTLGYNFRLK